MRSGIIREMVGRVTPCAQETVLTTIPIRNNPGWRTFPLSPGERAGVRGKKLNFNPGAYYDFIRHLVLSPTTMKKILSRFLLLAATLLAGCATSGPDSYLPLNTTLNGVENHDLLVLLDSRIQYSVACPAVEQHMNADGRLDVTARLRNRENHPITVQVNCVFKDIQNAPVKGGDIPFQNLVLSVNTIEPIHFVSPTSAAARCTICIRQPQP
jgi:hypothetical protein